MLWKEYKEAILCGLFLLALLIVWMVASINPEPPTCPPWEDPTIGLGGFDIDE